MASRRLIRTAVCMSCAISPYPRTFQRSGGSKFLANSHQPGHLGLGDLDFLAANSLGKYPDDVVVDFLQCAFIAILSVEFD